MKKNFKLIFILLLSVSLLVACTNNQKAEDRNFTDQMGRDITVGNEINKIISLAPSVTEMLYAMGLGEKVVGVTDFCNYPEAAQQIEKIGGFKGPNVEKIVEKAPDVIFSTTISQETVETLDKTGIPVIVLNPENIESIYKAIELIGDVCNAKDNADQLVNDMSSKINTIVEKVSGIKEDDKKIVYYEVWHEPPTTVGPNTFLNEVITTAGGKNLASDAKADWPNYSAEQILAKNPDVILLGHSGQKPNDITSRPGFNDIKAVKNDKVIAVDQDVFSRPGPRIVDAIDLLAKYMYPELFK